MKLNFYRRLSFILLFQLVGVPLLFGQGFLINQVKTLEIRNAATNKSYGDIEGCPYYTRDFVESRLFSNDGNFTDIPLRFDLFQDEMEFMKDGKIKWINKNEVQFINYGNDTIMVFYAIGDTSRQGYFFLKSRGKYSLFLKKTVSYQPLIPARGYADAIPDRFINENDEVFIRENDKPGKNIKNRKDLKEFFINDKTALDLIKKEKIKAENPEDLLKLVSFLNAL